MILCFSLKFQPVAGKSQSIRKKHKIIDVPFFEQKRDI
jgi:hypothetical protein